MVNGVDVGEFSSMPSEPHTLLMVFDAAHRAHRDGWPAPLVRGKDHKLAAELLEIYTMDQLQPLVAHFMVMEDEFIERAGYGFGVFKACLPKVLSSYQRKTRQIQKASAASEQMRRDIQQMTEWRNLTPEQRAQKAAEWNRQADERERFGKRSER